MAGSLVTRILKVAKGLSAQKSADAFVRTHDEPDGATPAVRNKAAEFESTVEAMFLMAAVDGDLAAEELAQLAASIDAFASLEGTSGDMSRSKLDPSKMLLAMNDRLGKEGWNNRLAAVAARLTDPESRAFAFRLAAGVAFVDDHVAHAEAAALVAMASALKISADVSKEICCDVREALFG